MTATMMALRTKPAGPSRQILSKMDSIAQSKIGIGSVLRAALQGNTAPYLQNAYVRVRSIFRKAGEAAAKIGSYLRWPQSG